MPSGIPEVWITGMGGVTSLGLSIEETLIRVKAGESGIGLIQSFDLEEFKIGIKIAGEVRGFDPEKWMSRKDANRMDLFSQYGVASAKDAVTSSGLEITDKISARVAVIMATGVGGLSTTINQVNRLYSKNLKVETFGIPKFMPNAVCGNVSMQLGCKGLGITPVSACSSAADAIGWGGILIRAGMADVVIAGGAEAAVNPLGIGGFESLTALANKFGDEPQKASRPFDKERSGFVMSDGGVSLVLESNEFAQRRGARPLAILAGYGATLDASHITAPSENGESGIEAIRLALEYALVEPSEVNYINAHGTATLLNDRAETLVIHEAYGEYGLTIPVSSTKSETGHLLGAGGALEAAICVDALQTGWAPPTINLDNPDPECNLNHIRGGPLQLKRGPKGRLVVVSHSFGFGGHNSVLVFISPEE